DPEARSTCESAAAGSLCIHTHNTNRAVRGIPKDVMPCEGSYLERLFASVGAESSPRARLPTNMVRLPMMIKTLEHCNQRLRLDFETLEKENARLNLDLAHMAGLQEKISRIYASKTWRLGFLLGTLARPLLVLWRLLRLYSDH